MRITFPTTFVSLMLIAPSARAQFVNTVIPNTYEPQLTDFYCGPASTEMVLNSTTLGLPASPLPSQDTLYATIHANNDSSATAYFSDPAGIATALTTYDPAAGGRTWSAFASPSFDVATRVIASSLSVVNGAMVKNAAPAVVGMQPYTHWNNVYGVRTAAPADPGTTFTVDGFYVHDPWTGYAKSPGAITGASKDLGSGTDAYLANNATGLWKDDFQAANEGTSTAKASKWNGDFLAVTDLPVAGVLATVPGDTTNLGDFVMTIPGTDPSSAVMAASMDLTTPGLAGGNSDLSMLSSFSGALSVLSKLTDITDENTGLTKTEWLIGVFPGGVPGIIDLPELTALLVVDGDTGALDAAFWNDDGSPIGATYVDDKHWMTDLYSGEFNSDNVAAAVPAPGASCLLAALLALPLLRRRTG